jgi:hypothetical protein
MEDLLEAILSGVIELVLEVVFQLLAETLTALAVRTFRDAVGEPKSISPILAGTGYLLLGAACGALSLLLWPHPLVHPSRFHGISLIISPVVTGFIMSQIGLMQGRRGKDAIRIESFAYGFTFALGVAAIRLFFVR